MIAPVARRGLARAWFALTALVVVVGTGTQLAISGTGTGGFFSDPLDRTLNQLVFFTIQSNLLVGLSAVLTALDPERDTLLRRVLRLTALVAITVTGLVYHVLLADLQDLSGLAWFADLLVHTVVPLLAVLGWVLFGPRGRTSWRVVGLSVLFPTLWGLFTLVRGPLVGGYWPYPFVAVDELGLARVLLNCAVLGVLFVALAAGAHGLDRLLRGRGAADDDAARPPAQVA